jgi:hypothetical protein
MQQIINKYMPVLSKLFRAAIEKRVRDIADGECDIADGELRKLNAPEKRQLLADLRKRDDCPDGWKNRKNMTPKKQQSIINGLHNAIERLVNPEKVKADNDRNNKRRRENGQKKAADDKRRENGKAKAAAKKYKESGQKKAADDRYNAKISKARHEANAQAILENKDHHEPTWDEATLEKEATENVKYIVNGCGRNGFVHVFVGAWPGKKLKEAVEAECFGRGKHAVFIDGGRRVHYHHVITHVKLLIPYTGTNCENADRLEERVQEKLLDMKWPQHRRMFLYAGMGSCKGKRDAGMPFPYYTGVLVCEQSMEQIGIRLR